MDCQKAFDTVSHTKLWKVLKKQGVPVQYVMLLQGLYTGQAAKVIVDSLFSESTDKKEPQRVEIPMTLIERESTLKKIKPT